MIQMIQNMVQNQNMQNVVRIPYIQKRFKYWPLDSKLDLSWLTPD